MLKYNSIEDFSNIFRKYKVSLFFLYYCVLVNFLNNHQWRGGFMLQVHEPHPISDLHDNFV